MLSRRPSAESDSNAQEIPQTASEIVVLYDDRESFRRATEILGNSICDLSNTVEVCLVPWRFAEIQCEPWRERALKDASDSDLLVVAARGETALPDDIIEWIATSFTRRYNRGGKVMMIHEGGAEGRGEPSSCSQLVRRIASFAGIEFVTPPPAAAVA